MSNEPNDQGYMKWFSKQYQQLDDRGRKFLHDWQESIRPKAEFLHTEAKWVYGLYGALDGLSCSFSILRFVFDARYANSTLSSADMLHDWLMTPEGFAFLIAESSAMISFATIGNLYIEKNLAPDSTPPKEIKFIAENWDWFRHAMKALKNGYRGVRNAIVFADLFSLAHDLRHLVLPAGLLLGGISMINRPKLNIMRDGRTDAINNLEKFIDEMNKAIDWRTFQSENQSIIENHNEQLESYQSYWLLAYISATYNGILDAPNLYFGAVTLTALPPAPWIFITVATFAVACLAARIYEEYSDQQNLLKTQIKFKLTVAKLNNNLQECEQYQKDLNKQNKLSYWSHFFGTITNSMDAYGALASIMFSAATICMLMSITFPPLLLSACIAAGAACLVVPLVYMSVRYFLEPDMKQVFFKRWFEICRSFFAGLNKGLRSMDSIVPSWQEMGNDGHYHNTEIMIPLAWMLSIPYALGFSSRAVAKVGEKTAGKTIVKPQEQKSPPSSPASAAKTISKFGLLAGKIDSTSTVAAPDSPKP